MKEKGLLCKGELLYHTQTWWNLRLKSRCYNSDMPKALKILLTLLLVGIFLVGAGLAIPGTRARLQNLANELKVKIDYAINPPQEAVFLPDEALATSVQATLLTSLTNTPTTTPPAPENTTQPIENTPLPSATPTPLPGAAFITGGRYETQHGLWNYCAPATLAMALSYWGWEGTRTDIGPIVKPYDKDKNVMPYELADYVESHAGLLAAIRSGGSLESLKRLIANDFSVLIEKGIVIRDYNGKLGWMGHYTVVTGYDDSKSEFTTQDSYFEADYEVSYEDLAREWQSFNYIFMVIYSPDEEQRLWEVLDAYADAASSDQIAAQTAAEEAVTLTGVQKFFAYYNRATSLVNLQDYNGAAQTYDQAFTLMAALEEQDRPWRIMWYQTGPYFAYYYTGRYQDVINLATTTIEAANEPYIEESFIWRARAWVATGYTDNAVEDIKKSLEYHPNYAPALELAAYLGFQP